MTSTLQAGLLAFTACATLFVVPAAAIPLSFSESVDLSDTAPGGNIGTLDVGLNTVSGQLSWLDGDLADYFSLTLSRSGKK